MSRSSKLIEPKEESHWKLQLVRSAGNNVDFQLASARRGAGGSCGTRPPPPVGSDVAFWEFRVSTGLSGRAPSWCHGEVLGEEGQPPGIGTGVRSPGRLTCEGLGMVLRAVLGLGQAMDGQERGEGHSRRTQRALSPKLVVYWPCTHFPLGCAGDATRSGEQCRVLETVV